MSTAVLVPGLAAATGRTKLFGFDPASGRILWTDLVRVEGPLAPPAIDPAEGLLVFTEGSSTRNSAVVAVDVSGRDERWRYSLQDISRGGPTIADGAVFVGSRDRFVYAIDAKKGTLRWKTRTEASVEVAPAVAGGRVYVVSQNGTTGDARLYSLDATTGKPVWSYSPRGVAIGASSPTVAEGVVFVGFGDLQVRAFDAARGTLKWSEPVRGFFSFRSTLAVSGGGVYAVDEGGGVYRFDRESGERAWDFQFPAIVSWSSPLVLGRVVYLGLDDGTVAAIDFSSGHLVWRTRLATGPIGAFAPTGDLLLAPSISSRGGLVAFRHDPSGSLLDLPSPTELDLPEALLNFGGGLLLVLALLLGVFRLLVRPRPTPELDAIAPSIEGGAEADAHGSVAPDEPGAESDDTRPSEA
jgi:outer membrane protein assembly factor BamB